MNIITCAACKKEFESASTCPHCGTKAPGKPFFKSLAKFSFYFVCFCILVSRLDEGQTKKGTIISNNSGKEISVQSSNKSSKPAEAIQETPPKKQNPGPSVNWRYNSRNVSPFFMLGTPHTEIQIEKLTEELEGKKIHWCAPIYQVQRDGNGYKIQFKNIHPHYCNAIAYVNSHNARLIERLMENQEVDIVGTFAGVFLKTITFKDATVYTSEEVRKLKEKDTFLSDLERMSRINEIVTFRDGKDFLNHYIYTPQSYLKIRDKIIEIDIKEIKPEPFHDIDGLAKGFRARYPHNGPAGFNNDEIFLVIPLDMLPDEQNFNFDSATIRGLMSVNSSRSKIFSPCYFEK